MRHARLCRALSFCVAASGILAGVPAAAQDSTAADPRAVLPERPTVATHAHTVAPGYVEIETGIEGDRALPGGRSYFSPTVVKVGLGSHVQLDLGFPVLFGGHGRSSGLGDAGVGLKWRLLDHDPVLGDFALLPSVKFPTGSLERGTGTGTTDESLTAIASYAIRGVSLDVNIAYTRVGAHGGNGPSSAALWTASFGVPVAGALSWQLEFFGYPTIDGSGDPSTVALLAGPSYLVGRILNLDVGFISPLRGRQPNAIYAGLVWNLGSLVPRAPAAQGAAGARGERGSP